MNWFETLLSWWGIFASWTVQFFTDFIASEQIIMGVLAYLLIIGIPITFVVLVVLWTWVLIKKIFKIGKEETYSSSGSSYSSSSNSEESSSLTPDYDPSADPEEVYPNGPPGSGKGHWEIPSIPSEHFYANPNQKVWVEDNDD